MVAMWLLNPEKNGIPSVFLNKAPGVYFINESLDQTVKPLNMSWLNISGNISSITSNITSFTREVLTEAGNKTTYDEDDDDHRDDDNFQEDLGEFSLN